MKGHRRYIVPLAMLAFVAALLGQATSHDNPFPEIGKKTDSAVFDKTKEVKLNGVITQLVTRPEQASILYFRFDAKDAATGAVVNWAVRIPPPLPADAVLRGCDLCLVDDFQPEMAKLTVGTMITVVGNPARDQSRRLDLVPQHGPATIAGVIVIPK